MSMFAIATSGLQASMAALNTVANNSVNAMTPGYSRQEASFASLGGGAYGGGAGVMVSGINRISNLYQVANLWQSNSEVGYATERRDYLGTMEQYFSADGNTINGGLDNLFAALSSAQQQPNETAYRQEVLNEAENLTNRFKALNDAMTAQLEQLEGQIDSTNGEINALLGNIADVNKSILDLGPNAQVPPTLLDERDGLIGELSQLIDVNVVFDNQGLANVTLPQGQPLVNGKTYGQFYAETNAANPLESEVKLDFLGTEFPLRGDEGGELGALIDFRKTEMNEQKAYLDELAVSIADEMNGILASGTDVNGNKPTEPLFTYNPNNPSGTISINPRMKPDMLAFGKDGTPGDNSNLKELLELANKPFEFDSLGVSVPWGESYTTKVGELGATSRQAQLYTEAAAALQEDAKNQWASTSGVNLDEEAANLIMYQQNYQANAKVISTAEQLFSTLINSF